MFYSDRAVSRFALDARCIKMYLFVDTPALSDDGIRVRQPPPKTGRAGGEYPPARVVLARSQSPVQPVPGLPPHPGFDVRHVEAVRAADPDVREALEPAGSEQLPQPVARTFASGDEPEVLRHLHQPDEMLAH